MLVSAVVSLIGLSHTIHSLGDETPMLEGSGDNTWTFVLYMLHALVKDSSEEGQVYAAPQGTTLQPVKSEAAPVAGEYLFKPKCELYYNYSAFQIQGALVATSHFTSTQGPQGARKRKVVNKDIFGSYEFLW